MYQGASDAVDFLHTGASVLRNHLIESQGCLFVATNSNQQLVVIIEVVDSAPGAVPLLPLAGGLLLLSLPPSLLLLLPLWVLSKCIPNVHAPPVYKMRDNGRKYCK